MKHNTKITLIIFLILFWTRARSFEDTINFLRVKIQEKCKLQVGPQIKLGGKVVESNQEIFLQNGKLEVIFLDEKNGLDKFQCGAMVRIPFPKTNEYAYLKYSYNIIYRWKQYPDLTDSFSEFRECFVHQPSKLASSVNPASLLFVSVDTNSREIESGTIDKIKPKYKLFYFFKIAELFRDLYMQNLRLLRVKFEHLMVNENKRMILPIHKLGEMVDTTDFSMKSESDQSQNQFEILKISDNLTGENEFLLPELRDQILVDDLKLIEKNDLFNLRVLFLRSMGLRINERSLGFCTKCDKDCQTEIMAELGLKMRLDGYYDVFAKLVTAVFVTQNKNVMTMCYNVSPLFSFLNLLNNNLKCSTSDQLKDIDQTQLKPGFFQSADLTKLYFLHKSPGSEVTFDFLDASLETINGIQAAIDFENNFMTFFNNNNQLRRIVPKYKECFFDKKNDYSKYELSNSGKLVFFKDFSLAQKFVVLWRIVSMISNFQKSGFNFLNFEISDFLFTVDLKQLESGSRIILTPQKFTRIKNSKDLTATELIHFCKPSTKISDAIASEGSGFCAGYTVSFGLKYESWNVGRLILVLLFDNEQEFKKNDSQFFPKMRKICKAEFQDEFVAETVFYILNGCFKQLPDERLGLNEIHQKLKDVSSFLKGLKQVQTVRIRI